MWVRSPLNLQVGSAIRLQRFRHMDRGHGPGEEGLPRDRIIQKYTAHSGIGKYQGLALDLRLPKNNCCWKVIGSFLRQFPAKHRAEAVVVLARSLWFPFFEC